MPTEEEPHRMTPQEKGHLGMTHGMTPQERGRRGAEARWGKTHEGGSEEVKGVEPGQEEHQPMSPSQRGKKGISHGMSPHDRGVLGAQARWAKAHPEGSTSPAEQHPTEASGQRGG